MLKTLGFALSLSVITLNAIAEERREPNLPLEQIEKLRKGGVVPNSELILAVFKDHWFAKVKESNFATLRPGSIYDLVVIFEQKFGLPRPLFNYFFTDTGLGTAEPLYPVFQTGYQKSWGQLIRSAWSDKHRHVDHYSTVITPEGCRIDSSYWIRSITKFPQYKAEMDQGYTLVDISFDYATKLRPDAQCGRHRANEPSKFDPNEYMKPFAANYRSPDDIPADMLAKYEYKVNVLKLVSRDSDRSHSPRYRDEYSMRANSLWFYPDAHKPDFGIHKSRPQPGLTHHDKAGDNLIPLSPELRKDMLLENFVSREDFAKLTNYLQGKPFPGFNPRKEPGRDTLDINEVTNKNFYTHGTDVEFIQDAVADTSNMRNFALTSAVIRPNEGVTDLSWKGERKIPQLRLVFQMMNPKDNAKPVEQLYLHVAYDGVDRNAAPEVQRQQAAQFMAQVDRLTEARKSGQNADGAIRAFLLENTKNPIMALNFSSSLTGIWVFGTLSREFNAQRELQPLKIVRQGIDVGYYSTLFDNEIFRQKAKKATGSRKEKLEAHLKTLTPVFYRDPRRFDINKITFNKMTCAQCHQMSARDGVHLSLNDGLDRRLATPVLPTEYMYKELDKQMKQGMVKPK